MDGNTIKCPSCGNDIPKGTKECYICGERLEKPVHVPKYAAGDEFDRVERIKRPKKMNDKTISYHYRSGCCILFDRAYRSGENGIFC